MIAYLDNSATTRPAEEVISAMSECMRSGYFNPSSLYEPALQAEKALNACRQEILAAGKRPDAKVIFTSGGTESNNLAILGSVAMMRGPQRVVVSPTEHPSVLEAFDELERQGHTVYRLNVDGEGQIDYAQLEEILREGVSLVSCMQVNNETGAVLDVRRLHDLVRQHCPGALIHVDGVQGFLRVPFDMKLADMYTLSGHKLHGPKGCGALVVGRNVRLKARNMGGGQENAVRSGTENTPGIAGLQRAIQLMRADSGMARRLREHKLYLLERFRAEIPEPLVNGPQP
ncbi:MAG: aminotransferase class V-fold PLP-dependent enzyme, partial [Clostridia bacterium]|nr:aminotransferase class V-fold PLP-dependent enzyme [Clostridia bacterium]